MSDKPIPFTIEKSQEIINSYGSPIYIYDEQGIRRTASELKAAFAWAKGYKNYFAVKATPTPGIIKILHEEGMGFDCSSYAELEMMRRMGISGNDIFFTSNNTSKSDFEFAIELGAIVNIDDLTQVPVFIEALGNKKYPFVAIRYNPGEKHSGNKIIGNPIDAKYGMTLEQLVSAFGLLTKANIAELGLHTMVASNEINPEYFKHTARLIKDAKDFVEDKVNIKITFVNIGGGLGINYKPDQKTINVEEVARLIKNELSDPELEILTENGRFVTGPHGYLVTKVRYEMTKYKNYLGVDASMHNLMRPGMYGAYHHISVMGKENSHKTVKYDVVGSLCENNDKFAIDRVLPQCGVGDILVIHDSGAHGHSMGFSYNGLLRSPEVLLKSDGTYELIRRAETIEDYFGTVLW